MSTWGLRGTSAVALALAITYAWQQNLEGVATLGLIGSMQLLNSFFVSYFSLRTIPDEFLRLRTQIERIAEQDKLSPLDRKKVMIFLKPRIEHLLEFLREMSPQVLEIMYKIFLPETVVKDSLRPWVPPKTLEFQQTQNPTKAEDIKKQVYGASSRPPTHFKPASTQGSGSMPSPQLF